MAAIGAVNNMQNGACCSQVKALKWNIPQVTATQSTENHNYAVLVLNRPITQSQNFMKNFWNNASVRITVDGGTIQWDKYLSKMSEDARKTIKLPDLITGDFDSITEDVKDKYKNLGCKIIHTPDQDHTDFTKALMELYNHCKEQAIELEHIIAIGQSSGRLDQILGNIQTLFLVKEQQLLSPSIRVYLMSYDSLSWLLYPGDHVITIPEETLKYKKTWCSLVPIGEMCESITTTGLKWNLDKQPMKFGDLVSTSNTFDGSEIVTVNCSHALLFSMRIPSVGSQ